jgi:hypothetical protein
MQDKTVTVRTHAMSGAKADMHNPMEKPWTTVLTLTIRVTG